MTSDNQGNAYVLGVGMAAFLKPRATRMYTELAFEAGIKAMLDSHITYDDVEAGVACYTSGSTCSGQRVFYQFGMTDIPIYNTNNACATGSTGLHLARTFVKSGAHDCVMVVGFEQMNAGPLVSNVTDRPTPLDLSVDLMQSTWGKNDAPRNPQMFGNAGREYIEKYGASPEDFAEIARISHEHSSRNPYAQFRNVYSLEEIQKSPMIYYPLTKLQCSPTSDGAAAAIIVSQKFLDARPELKSHAILIAGQSLKTDSPSLYSGSALDLVGYEMTRRATKAALTEAGATPSDIKVCELHDCFSANELISLDAMGFSEAGKAHHLVRNGDITYGGKGPIVNPSGGLISKGHPLGATGVAQCAELTWQLRGWAKNGRLVPETDVALQHNLGLGGAIVVTVYRRADGKKNIDAVVDDMEIAKVSGLGYNPAVEARYVTREQAQAVRSKKAPSEYALADTLDKITARL
ncbi:acetyl-CoA acetyltransferase [Aspergillus affinis]|uniref:acetyl-CoA acetyltransferase n=1 Tax=Aspergillus affinis TaxID=1070780 RepID=UPI0022FE8F56|nr:acetyl-CoA acetyltransferase [Aspergillus affinis]KAI9044516.1 acetyl-CoA acetyltransferase [Aspergillus affinis]